MKDNLEDTRELHFDKKNTREPRYNKNRKLIFFVCFFVFSIIALIVLIIWSPFSLKKGSVKIEYGAKYKEPGFIAKKYGKNYTKNVKVSNNINYKKTGKYRVKYKVKIGFMTYEAIRNVEVVDTKKPKIVLKGSDSTDVCPSKEYTEEGYEASDNYDGDLTKKVKIKKNKESVEYSVKDSSGNEFKIIRKLVYQDKIKPEVIINGDAKISVTEGEAYIDQSANAVDNCDGDIASKIEVSGGVDSYKAGEYKVIYKVKDSSGNEASAERVVSVVRKASLNDGRPGTIYLTFDDGPNQGTTNVILDILKEEGVKATFFVTNNGPDSLIKREYDEGHTVALHTATHNYATIYSSDDAYYQDLYSVQARVRNITGYNSTIIRFPGGSSNTVSRSYSSGIMSRLTQSTLAKGFKYYDWNISSGDAGGTTNPQGVYSNVVNSLRKNKVNMVLMHDIKWFTRDALRDIIRYGKEAGYSFEKITMDTPMITQGVNN